MRMVCAGRCHSSSPAARSCGESALVLYFFHQRVKSTGFQPVKFSRRMRSWRRMDHRYGSHTVFQIEYHFVWVTKYR